METFASALGACSPVPAGTKTLFTTCHAAEGGRPVVRRRRSGAKGISMTQKRCTGEDAFLVLVRASQSRNGKLTILAEQLVANAGPLDAASKALVEAQRP